MYKILCDKLFNNEDFLSYDKQDADAWICRCNEQFNFYAFLYSVNQFKLAYEFGVAAQNGELDINYYSSEWEIEHCDY